MKALVYRGVGDVALQDVPRPVVQAPGDAVVRVTTTSICGSDLHILHGLMPGLLPGTIVGHEFTGVVEEVGADVTGVRPGDRVVAPAAVWCGSCRACRAGLPMKCERAQIFGCGAQFGDLDGAQAESVRVPFADVTLVPIPDGLTDEQVIFAGDILATAYTAVVGLTPRGGGVRAGDQVVVFGAGPVGLCAVACAKLFEPAQVIAVDREPYRLEVARRLGADQVIDAATTDARKAIRGLTEGWGADYTVEAVGRPETLTAGLLAAAPGGTVSVVGVFPEPVLVPIPRMMARNVSLSVGMGNLRHVRELVGLLGSDRLDLTPIITHRLPLDEVVRGYEIFEQKLDGAIKVLLRP